jgi:hypothetical protein
MVERKPSDCGSRSLFVGKDNPADPMTVASAAGMGEVVLPLEHEEPTRVVSRQLGRRQSSPSTAPLEALERVDPRAVRAPVARQ